MSKKFLFVASILLTIIVGAVLFWYYCCDCGGKSMGEENLAIPPAPEPREQVPASPEPVPEVSTEMNWEAVRDQVNSNAPTLYFEAYQTESKLSAEAKDKLLEIVDYLENNPEGGLLVTGHSDISGPRDLNINLSQKRALFLESVLVQTGIGADKITTTFKGPDDPIADNNTAQGRAKNRRAVVIIK